MAIEVTETKHIIDDEYQQVIAWTSVDNIHVGMGNNGGALTVWATAAELQALSDSLLQSLAEAADRQSAREEAKRVA